MSLFNRNDKANEIQPPSQSDPPKVPEPVADVRSAWPPPDSVAKPAAAPIVKPIPTKPHTTQGVSMASVISKALKITGELESTEDIQIDGQIDGDVRGVGVKIGQNARVKGTVYGDEVELAGTVEGRIESKKVILAGTARMTGDIWHQDIKIESGAYISGSLKPEMGKPDSKADVKADAKPGAKSATAAIITPAPNKDTVTAPAHH
jgi:cytoskeletal protein CcmA (bactofilin family)